MLFNYVITTKIIMNIPKKKNSLAQEIIFGNIMKTKKKSTILSSIMKIPIFRMNIYRNVNQI